MTDVKMKVVASSVFEIFNENFVYLTDLYDVQDGLEIDIDIFNQHVYQYILERFDDSRLDLIVTFGRLSAVDRPVYVIRQPDDTDLLVLIKVKDFLGYFDGGINNKPRLVNSKKYKLRHSGQKHWKMVGKKEGKEWNRQIVYC